MVRSGKGLPKDNILWMNFANQGTWMSDEQTLDEFMEYMVRSGSLPAEKRPEILEQWKQLRAGSTFLGFGKPLRNFKRQ